MSMGHILFVDDDEAGRELSRYNLEEAGHRVTLVADGEAALSRFSPDEHDLVVTDLRMPRLGGMELLRRLAGRTPEVPVIVITAHGSVETAVEAMKAGAYDFIEKPFGRDVLLLTVARALEHRRLTRENRRLRIRAAGVEREIISVSRAMSDLLRAADRVARSDAAVLITGESGTGKELVARRIHARGPRAERPFAAINCAAVPAELLEAELFGHERGAYTGATRARAGRFRAADGGTILLDEIGELPPALQGKLLRAVQEKTVDVVGADRPVTVDVRVLAATNRSLTAAIADGRFREDLYYRLNVVELEVPPLRERPEDIEPLARHFVAQFAEGRDLELPDLVLSALAGHAWPGNVRELQNACERLVVLAGGDTLRVEDLPPSLRSGTAAAVALDEWPPLPPEGLSLVDLERRVIERALKLQNGNVTRAAAFLRVPRHVLAYRIEKYGIRRE
jgi:two-component system NtrC family response regulator